ncbi:TetR/AcrR family transcriptional regulator [Mycobacterium sp. M26]|uniref:TetR/AcrR family transcriptional regulator n=1 Tax=Mycobacterium sp. M26 TaxID=1762962 RepID=UPI00073E9BE4|nr:TetR/AcrR family transcriptional regulator [Mycobacterium sp. M26]
MAVQARAEATRQKIVESAVDLFDSVGYGDTGLADIMSHAEITKGAFYYHFSSKDAVASAIIEQSEDDFRESMIRIISATDSPALDNLMRATFAVAHMHTRDPLTRVANQLRQSLSQVTETGAEVYTRRQSEIFGVMTDAIRRGMEAGDLTEDVDADAVARTLWAASLGNRILSDALGDDIFAHLSHIWQVLVRAIVPTTSVRYFHELASRMGQQYADHGIDRSTR